MLDSSGSITWQDPLNWERILAFVAEIVSQFPVTRDLTHVGVVTFSTLASVEFRLDRHESNADVNRTIYGIKHRGGETNIAEGLRLMRTEVFTRRGDRDDAKDIAIVITDGVANEDADRVEAEARRAKEDQGIEIFTIGITNRVDEYELDLIASEPYSRHKFLSPDFNALQNILAEVKRRACEVSPPIISTPSPSPPTTTTTTTTQRTTTTTMRPTTTTTPYRPPPTRTRPPPVTTPRPRPGGFQGKRPVSWALESRLCSPAVSLPLWALIGRSRLRPGFSTMTTDCTR